MHLRTRGGIGLRHDCTCVVLSGRRDNADLALELLLDLAHQRVRLQLRRMRLTWLTAFIGSLLLSPERVRAFLSDRGQRRAHAHVGNDGERWSFGHHRGVEFLHRDLASKLGGHDHQRCLLARRAQRFGCRVRFRAQVFQCRRAGSPQQLTSSPMNTAAPMSAAPMSAGPVQDQHGDDQAVDGDAFGETDQDQNAAEQFRLLRQRADRGAADRQRPRSRRRARQGPRRAQPPS